MEELVRTVILPRLDQLEAELHALRNVTWPVCQSIREKGDPLKCAKEKRIFFAHMYKDDAIELLKKKAEFNSHDALLLDQELDLICLKLIHDK